MLFIVFLYDVDDDATQKYKSFFFQHTQKTVKYFRFLS